MDLDEILNQKPETLNLPEIKMPDSEFLPLEQSIMELRAKIQQGHAVNKEEMRQIVVFFRARRARLNQEPVVLKKEKVKVPKVKAPPKPRAKKKIEIEPQDLQDLLTKLGI